MIKSFADKRTEKVFRGKQPKDFPVELIRRSVEKLHRVHAAIEFEDLRTPPGNQLESLSGNRLRQHSIRINQQWRICFRWEDGHAHDVEITDYH